MEHSNARKISSGCARKLDPRSGTLRPSMLKGRSASARLSSACVSKSAVTMLEETRSKYAHMHIETGPLDVGPCHSTEPTPSIGNCSGKWRRLSRPSWGLWSISGTICRRAVQRSGTTRLLSVRRYSTVELVHPEVVVQKLGSGWWFPDRTKQNG